MELKFEDHCAYPNQKVVYTQKAPCDKENMFTSISHNALSHAIKNLCPKMRTSSPFVLWCYLAKNKPDVPFYMSNTAFTNYTGMSKDAYDYAVKTLIERGYLEKVDERVYVFNEICKTKSGS